jgi:hypothetical protein
MPTTPTATIAEVDCVECFPPKPYRQNHGHTCSVPQANGTYVRHIVRSFYTWADDRPCAWQQQDFAERTRRILGKAS